MSGVQAAGGALNIALNDATGKGAYTLGGALRVTDAAGTGLTDASGALRVVSIASNGVYQIRSATIRYSNATTDGKTGVQFSDGSIRMTGFP